MELKRAAWHVMTISILALAMAVLPRQIGLIFAFTLLPLLIGFDYLRLKLPALNKQFIRLFGWGLRDSELSGHAKSVIDNGIAAVIIFTAFPKPISYLSMLALAFSDPAARLVGHRFGRIHIGKKTLEGSIACFVAISAVLFYEYGLNSFVPALIGTVAELLPIKKLDDNFRIPLSVALALKFLI